MNPLEVGPIRPDAVRERNAALTVMTLTPNLENQERLEILQMLGLVAEKAPVG